MDLERLENELKQRWQIPYEWKGMKQNNRLDRLTQFIYTTYSFNKLLAKAALLNEVERHYAYNRWYNYWSARAVEYIFSFDKNVIKNPNPYDKAVDFSLYGINFDHKTSIFPKKYNKSIDFAIEQKQDLVHWLYINQSQEGRKHINNRIFIVLYAKNQAHWKIKAEINQIQKGIQTYLAHFNPNQLLTIKVEGETVLSDIIFIKQ